jgi:hypothetical protein
VKTGAWSEDDPEQEVRRKDMEDANISTTTGSTPSDVVFLTTEDLHRTTDSDEDPQ